MKLFTDMQSKMVEMTKDGQPDGADIAKAQKDMERAIRQLLTPQEALEFDLRFSMTANSLRNQVAGFDPSEQEFLAIYNLRKPFDDEFSPMTRGNETAEERKKREAAQKQLDERIKQTLGSARYEDYQRAQDWSFQQIHRSVKRSDLGTDAAVNAYEMKKLAEEQANKLRSDRNLTADQRNAALQAIREETEQSMRQALGEKGWEHYNRGNNTYWLNNISRRE